MANRARVQEVINRIEADPAGFYMGTWVGPRRDEDSNVCGTTMCVAGHAVMASGAKLSLRWDGTPWFFRNGEQLTPSVEAIRYLELSPDELVCANGESLFYTDEFSALIHLKELAS